MAAWRWRRAKAARRHAQASRPPASTDLAPVSPSLNIHAPFIIGVAGASGSGKTTVCERIVDALKHDMGSRVVVISSDCYYKGLGGADPMNYNFDEPSAVDFDLMRQHLSAIKRGERVDIPHYDFKVHSRTSEVTRVEGVDVVLLEGILVLFPPHVRELMDMKLFALEDPDICLVRRLRRDIVERGRDVENVLRQYERFVKPAYERFIRPSMVHADMILPRAGRNEVAIDLLLRDVKNRVRRASFDA